MGCFGICGDIFEYFGISTRRYFGFLNPWIFLGCFDILDVFFCVYLDVWMFLGGGIFFYILGFLDFWGGLNVWIFGLFGYLNVWIF